MTSVTITAIIIANCSLGCRYRTQWLLNIADGPDKTFPTHGAHEASDVTLGLWCHCLLWQ